MTTRPWVLVYVQYMWLTNWSNMSTCVIPWQPLLLVNDSTTTSCPVLLTVLLLTWNTTQLYCSINLVPGWPAYCRLFTQYYFSSKYPLRSNPNNIITCSYGWYNLYASWYSAAVQYMDTCTGLYTDIITYVCIVLYCIASYLTNWCVYVCGKLLCYGVNVMRKTIVSL